jgi:hypothetical protein
LLLGGGAVPETVRPAIDAETPLLIEEDRPTRVTYRNYRAPHQRSKMRREWYRGPLVEAALAHINHERR